MIIYLDTTFSIFYTTFLPVNITPVSSDYILGPGDKLRVDFYEIKKAEEVTINREGNVILPMLGKVNFLGMNLIKLQRF